MSFPLKTKVRVYGIVMELPVSHRSSYAYCCTDVCTVTAIDTTFADGAIGEMLQVTNTQPPHRTYLAHPKQCRKLRKKK
jgi:hypothetical protein